MGIAQDTMEHSLISGAASTQDEPTRSERGLKSLSMQESGEGQPGKRLPGKPNESCLSDTGMPLSHKAHFNPGFCLLQSKPHGVPLLLAQGHGMK